MAANNGTLLTSSSAYMAAWVNRRAEWEPLLPAWRGTHQRYTPSDLGFNPEWCQGTEAAHPGIVRLLTLSRGGEVEVVVPFLLRRSPLDCRLGEYRVVRFQPRMLLPAGEDPALGEDETAWEALFAALRPGPQLDFDVLRFVAPTGSWLWAYLRATAWQRFGLHPYQPGAAVRRHGIALPASFALYAAKFTAKTRGNRVRECKNLQRRGTVELVCYREASGIEAFLAQAETISARSYQHRLLSAGLPPRARLRPRLEVAARHGWLRSYVLRCGGEPCSYILGYQYGGRYHYMAVGYDPAWRQYGVGTVLQWMVLQEMFAHDPPAFFDFGPAAPQKEYFGNFSYEEATLLLFRPGLAPGLMRSLHQGSRWLSVAAAQTLTRYQLKGPVRRLLRRLRGC